jgi:hypothetical protein
MCHMIYLFFLHDMATLITFARSKIHEDRDCLICSNLLLLSPTYVQISVSAPYFYTPWDHAFPKI